jgi:hypothetical protein
VLRIEKLRSQESIWNVSSMLCCTWNCCQHFFHEKTLIEEFWGLSFEDCRTYGMDIPRRLHVKRDMKQWKFITIQEIEICETTWWVNKRNHKGQGWSPYQGLHFTCVMHVFVY